MANDVAEEKWVVENLAQKYTTITAVRVRRFLKGVDIEARVLVVDQIRNAVRADSHGRLVFYCDKGVWRLKLRAEFLWDFFCGRTPGGNTPVRKA